jgi:hypothetical protein
MDAVYEVGFCMSCVHNVHTRKYLVLAREAGMRMQFTIPRLTASGSCAFTKCSRKMPFNTNGGWISVTLGFETQQVGV